MLAGCAATASPPDAPAPVAIAGTIDQPAALRPLDRVEYANALRELFDLPVDPARLSEPAASSSTDIARIVLGRASERTQVTFRIPADATQDYAVEGLPFGTRGGATFHHVFPADGHYTLSTFPVTRGDADFRPLGEMRGEQLEVLVDGERVKRFDWDREFDAAAGRPTTLDLTVQLKAGPHVVGVTFVARHYAPLLDLNQPFDRSTFFPRIGGVRIDGPIDGAPATDSPSRRRLLVCHPARPKDEPGCARRIIDALATRAWRGNVKRADRKALFATWEAVARAGGFESGVEAVVARVLADPKLGHRGESPNQVAYALPTAGDVPDDLTALSLATIAGDAGIVRQLLQAGAKANDTLPNGETPLMLAARTGSVDTMRALLDAGADVDAKETLRGTTALMWAAAAANAAAVKLLLDAKADVAATSARAPLGARPFLAETAVERLDRRRRGIVQRERPPPPDRGGGLTALIFAAREGDIESAKLLIEAGADVNQRSGYGWSPLLAAIHHRHYRLAKTLLDAGADPNLANQGGWTALYLATDNRNAEGGDYPARQPDMDDLEIIRSLLARGANVNARMRSSTDTRSVSAQQWLREEGATPLLRAAQSGDVELVKLLLSRGADPKINTELGVTPLMAACGIGWVEGITSEWSRQRTHETIRLLIARGADVNARDKGDGRTALMGAAHKGDENAVRMLVTAGAKLDARDLDGFGPIDYAEGRVRIGVQPVIAHPATAALLRALASSARGR